MIAPNHTLGGRNGAKRSFDLKTSQEKDFSMISKKHKDDSTKFGKHYSGCFRNPEPNIWDNSLIWIGRMGDSLQLLQDVFHQPRLPTLNFEQGEVAPIISSWWMVRTVCHKMGFVKYDNWKALFFNIIWNLFQQIQQSGSLFLSAVIWVMYDLWA